MPRLHDTIPEATPAAASMPARRVRHLCAAALLLGAAASAVAGYALVRQRTQAAHGTRSTHDTSAATATPLSSMGPGGGLRGPSSAPAGGSVVVTVGTSDTVIEIVDPSTGEITAIPVGPDRRVTIPVPTHAGELLVRVGSGKRCRVLVIEIEAPSP
ncbi:MAG: hypothetical protein KDC48_14635 [Planctomycetes bacterium]|nr:hypothetical protein [Planctomycetota bacterium]